MNDLISVIVPVYNVEKYIDRCVQSIVDQHYRNIEILLIDDGSTDKSAEICDRWGKKDDRIVVVHKKNGGLSDARNHGISISKGSYLTFVDSDDYIDKRFVKCLSEQIEDTGSDISCVGVQLFGDEEQVQIDDMQYKTRLYNKEEAIAALFYRDSFRDYTWNKMYKKQLFDNVGFPKGKIMEDLSTTYRLFERCKLISYCPAKLYFYFQRENSILHNRNNNIDLIYYNVCKERYLYIKDKYPYMKKNYKFFNGTIIHSFMLLNGEEAEFAKRELKQNYKYGMIQSTWKDRMKMLILLLDPRLFLRLKKSKSAGYM